MVMKPDLPLAPSVWHDFYAVTGFAPGTDVVFCNRSSTRIVLFEGPQPDPSTLHGAEIQPGAWGRVRGQSAWLKGNATVLIGGLQEYQP